jgi:hypothetical protein
MTHEHFCIWLAGYLEGNADMDLDLKDLLRDKLAYVGAAPAKVQPRSDVPKTPDQSPFRGLVGGASDGVARGGFHHAPPAGISLSGPMGLYDPTVMTVCTNTANAATNSADAAMSSLSAAARACE